MKKWKGTKDFNQTEIDDYPKHFILSIKQELKIIEEEFSRCQNSLEQITNSKSWRMIEKIRKIKSKIIRGKV